jgi:hypothetical protein
MPPGNIRGLAIEWVPPALKKYLHYFESRFVKTSS